MLFGGPGLVMLSRAAEPIKEATGLSSAAILAVWALILLAGDPALASVVGDHGEQFGEFGKTGHGNSVFPPVLRVPLILHIPNQATRSVETAVTTTGIHPTLLASHGESAFSAAGDGFQLIRDQSRSETLLSGRDGARVDASTQPAFVDNARKIIASAMAAQRGSGEFRALGYLN